MLTNWDFCQVQGFFLALLCGLSALLPRKGHRYLPHHTTPARTPEDRRLPKIEFQGIVSKTAIRIRHPGVGGWWENNLQHSLENNSVTAEHFVCIGLKGGAYSSSSRSLLSVWSDFTSLSHWCYGSVVWGWGSMIHVQMKTRNSF